MNQSTNATDDAHTHWAFISYRHADNKEQDRGWAGWLHQEIERYEIPAELVGTKNKRGDIIPERIYPVFRDEESLPADADLANSISTALDKSRFLTVLCSPRAVESQYVAQEIDHFKKSGKSDRIIAAIIAGEPGDKENECFPVPLREVVTPDGKLNEPIAADFRLPNGEEGFTSSEAYKRQLLKTPSKKQAYKLAEAYDERLHLMKLKIIAGILGVGIETLRNRDKAYQLSKQKKRAKQLRKWLAAMSLLALAAIGGGVVAWRNQQKAIEQTNRANTALSEKKKEYDRAESEKRRAVEEQKKAIAAAKLAEQRKVLAEKNEAKAKRQEGIAAENAKLAKDNEAIATQEKEKALKSRTEAVKQRNIAQSAQYRATMQLIGLDLVNSRYPSARKRLAGLPAESRDDLWSLLYSIAGSSSIEINKQSLAKIPWTKEQHAELEKIHGLAADLRKGKYTKKDKRIIAPSKSKSIYVSDWKWGQLIALQTLKGGLHSPVFEAQLGTYPVVDMFKICQDETGVFLYLSDGGTKTEPITRNHQVLVPGTIQWFPFINHVPLSKVEYLNPYGLSHLDKKPEDDSPIFGVNRSLPELSEADRLIAINFAKKNLNQSKVIVDLRNQDNSVEALLLRSDKVIEHWNISKNKFLQSFGTKQSVDKNMLWLPINCQDATFDDGNKDCLICFNGRKLIRYNLTRKKTEITFQTFPDPKKWFKFGEDGGSTTHGNVLSDGKYVTYRYEGRNRTEHYIWDYKTGKMLQGNGIFSVSNKSHTSSPYSDIHYHSPSKKWIRTESGKTIIGISPLNTDKSVVIRHKDDVFIPHKVAHIYTTSPDGRYFAYANHIYEVSNSELVITLPEGAFLSQEWDEIYFPYEVSNSEDVIGYAKAHKSIAYRGFAHIDNPGYTHIHPNKKIEGSKTKLQSGAYVYPNLIKKWKNLPKNPEHLTLREQVLYTNWKNSSGNE